MQQEGARLAEEQARQEERRTLQATVRTQEAELLALRIETESLRTEVESLRANERALQTALEAKLRHTRSPRTQAHECAAMCWVLRYGNADVTQLTSLDRAEQARALAREVGVPGWRLISLDRRSTLLAMFEDWQEIRPRLSPP
jgi:hypothetical protein